MAPLIDYGLTTGSPKRSLSTDDVISVLKGLGIAIMGAVLTYLADVVLPQLVSQFGDGVLFVLFSTLVNLARKYFFDTREFR